MAVEPPKPETTERHDAEAEAGEAPRHDTHELPVTMGTMQKAFRLNEIWTFIVAVATAGAALLGSYTLFIDKAEAAGRKEAETVKEEVRQLREEVQAMKDDNGELKKDVRALYRAVMTRQPQDRLEKPIDGGTP